MGVSFSGSGFHCPNVNFNLQERVDHKRFKNVTSWGACSNICRERPFCKYWVWHDTTKVELQTMVQEYFIIIRAFSALNSAAAETDSLSIRDCKIFANLSLKLYRKGRWAHDCDIMSGYGRHSVDTGVTSGSRDCRGAEPSP